MEHEYHVIITRKVIYFIRFTVVVFCMASNEKSLSKHIDDDGKEERVETMNSG